MRASRVRHNALWRTTPFRLALLFGVAYVAGIAVMLGLVYFQTASFLARRSDRIIVSEAHLLSQSNPGQLLSRLQQEARRVPLDDFALSAADGRYVAGDGRLGVSQVADDGRVHEFLTPGGGAWRRGLATRLSSGETLIVARDIGQLVQLRRVLLEALMWSGSVIVVLGLASGVALSLEPLRRIQSMRTASDRIMAGELGARLPVGRRGDELDELASIVNVMMNEIERLVAQARTAGESVAHELRTPLTRLRMTLEHARSALPAGDPSRPMLEMCVGETDGVLSRFQALLRIAAVEAKRRKAEIAALDLSELMEQLAELYQPLAIERGLGFRADIPVGMEARVDGDLFFEAIANLLSNAIKFTGPGGKVALTLGYDGETLFIEVSDDGPGIMVAEHLLVTRRFYRSPMHQKVPGHGLGLSLVAAVVDLHGFHLSFHDAAPGARVRILFAPRPTGL